MKKKSTLLLACLAVSGCAERSYACHRWTLAQVQQAQRDDRNIPHASPLHAMIKDYERLCAE